MKRAGLFSSPLGFMLTILLFAGLGFSLWRDRGLAFSPGAITAKTRPGVTIENYTSHAEFEKECSFCHDPLRATLAQKCIECHTQIGEQISRAEGLHGKLKNVERCNLCHPEHQGREFDPSAAAHSFFDHSITRFSLTRHQLNFDATAMSCAACHTGEGLYTSVADSDCENCHRQHDATLMTTHLAQAGARCQACHDGKDRMRDFDHNATAFPLDGRHTDLVCMDCHAEGQFKDIPHACQDCHAEPIVHQGILGLACGDCHTAAGWKPARYEGQSFDHAATTRFSLNRHPVDYTGATMTCAACHPANAGQSLAKADLQICITCHAQRDQAFMDQHQADYGTACLDCHDGVDRLSNFDHNLLFPLDGRHAEADCAACHRDSAGGKRFRNTPTTCVECHPEPEIHAGVFGVDCEYCHTTQAWSPANLRQHTFPLNHGLEDGAPQTACETCHTVNYTTYTCYGCHEHQAQDIQEEHDQEVFDKAGVSRDRLLECAICHPTGTEEP